MLLTPLTISRILVVLVSASSIGAQTYSATYLPSNAPDKTEQGQSGTNQCGTALNQTGLCQNAYVNSVDDWCVWGPPNPGPDSMIGSIERIAVAWCIKNGTGSRLIPDGAITGAHFLQTPDFVQVTGVGNLQLINIPAGDAGGEMDPHGADGNGNPIGGLVFTTAFGELQQIHEWTNFISEKMFCIRLCKPGPRAQEWCEHIYDVMGCQWNIPANYDSGVFESCKGDSGQPMGVYGASKFHQGEPVTPPPHPAPSSSSCTTLSTIGNGFSISGTNIAKPTITSTPGGSGSTRTASETRPPSSTASAASSNSAVSSHGSPTVVSRYIVFMIGFGLYMTRVWS